ncbi:MAG: tripartite tricarboxylate transporter substrate binding protein [Rhodovarius sp.]|nr:tripartite tricarboxylate transporter substrate binding protein [Rhodovarius sp.]MDW8313820.1 tripartite tricarboxylate transporter substrate binding protein [Rhodovarius sp.]
MLRRTALLLPLAAPALAAAQPIWRPDRPVRIIVPFPPGGSNDVIARPLAEKLQPRLGQPVVIENRAGAGGVIGAQAVAQAPADGLTLMLTSTSFVASAVVQRTPYDPQGSFDPVAIVGRAPFIVLVTQNHPARDLAGLIAYARAHPGRIDYGSSGPGSIGHFLTEQLALLTGVQMTHIPYRGMAPAVTDLIAGNIQLLVTTIASANAAVREGRVRLLAYLAPGAPDSSPPAPTIQQALGLEMAGGAIWWGVFGPRGLPAPVLASWQGAIREALTDPDIARIYETEGARPAFTGAEAFRAELAADLARFRDVAQRARIRPE